MTYSLTWLAEVLENAGLKVADNRAGARADAAMPAPPRALCAITPPDP